MLIKLVPIPIILPFIHRCFTKTLISKLWSFHFSSVFTGHRPIFALQVEISSFMISLESTTKLVGKILDKTDDIHEYAIFEGYCKGG